MSFYAVAGVTGRVGSVVARELIARGAKVRAIVRDSNRGRAWAERGAEIAVGALEDPAFLTRTLEGASGFFTLLPEDPAASDFHGYRRRMAESIAAAVKRSRVPHVVMHSAIPAYLAERNGPAKDLHVLEQALAATGALRTIHRACYFQENVASVFAPARHAGIFPNFMPSADAEIPMIATEDVGRFAARALVASPTASEVVDLVGPAYSSRQLAEKLGALLGRPLQVVDIPPAAQVGALTEAGLPPAFAEAVAEMYAAFAAGLIAPKGERMIRGETTIDEVLPRLLAGETQTATPPPGR